MSDSDSQGGCLVVVMFIGMAVAWIGSGIVAWNWIEPDSFGRALLFLLVWGILGKVLDFIISAVMLGLANLLE